MSGVSEEGIEVLVRIRPVAPDEDDQRRCVLLSESEENTIVVETNNKKEFFSFDYIASELCHQQELYERLGQPVLDETLKGYNCCVFSYGQTGAGKTYSILGHQADLVENQHAESRGILPRMLEEMFVRINDPQTGFRTVTISCSYLQIYNQQIIDLMTKESKNLTVREDLKRGVFVEGLTELTISSYEQVLAIITRGLAVRKTASTFMNSESSRSHTIFTMLLNIEYLQDDVKRNLTSKLHVVDLAGSERTKLAKVQGERLKEGCNINKSLLTLSNVICSLVESSKKKKYIPFRDSKLTFFLKDSLGGNSKTKLLANISPKVSYLGDTISTLMFAKRAKIIRCKVQPNQNIADNFQSLRTQIRKLREELAQTKFIKTPPTLRAMSPLNRRDPLSCVSLKEVFLPIESCIEVNTNNSSQFEDTFKLFQDNEAAYRSIIEQSMLRLQDSKGMISSVNFKNLFQEKKRLEKTVVSQQKLLANFPAFSRLFSENIQLKRRLNAFQVQVQAGQRESREREVQMETLMNTIQLLRSDIQHLQEQNEQILNSRYVPPSPSKFKDPKMPVFNSLEKMQNLRNHASQRTSLLGFDDQIPLTRNRRNSSIVARRTGYRDIVQRQNLIIDEYEGIMTQMRKSFSESMNVMRMSYLCLQELYNQEKKQKQEIRKQKRREPELQTLANENEYLKLNVMKLQTEIAKLEQDLFRRGVEIRAGKEGYSELQRKLEGLEKTQFEHGIKESELESLIQKVKLIKIQAEKADWQVNLQLDKENVQLEQTKNKLARITKQNYSLLAKNEALVSQIGALKGRMSGLISIDQSVIEFKEGLDGMTTIDVDEDFTFQKTLHQDIVNDLQRLTLQKQRLNRQIQESQKHKAQQQSILQKASSRILSLTKDMNTYKESSASYAQQVRATNQQMDQLRREEKKHQDKTRVLEVDLTRLRKQVERNDNVAVYIRSQFGTEPMEFVEEAKSLKERNLLLNEQNTKLRETLADIQKKTSMLKISKSLSNLSTVKEVIGVPTTPKNLVQVKEAQSQSGAVSQRQGDNTFRKKEQTNKKNLVYNPNQQKQKEKEKDKPSLQFKSKPPIPTLQSFKSAKKLNK